MEIEPTRVQIVEQLERIATNDGFASSPSKLKFLRYIVEKYLDGQTDQLKGYSIGLDVFDRGEHFDPQSDTIVRVQARNLRRALDHYYLTHGKDDPVRIDIPKGRYVPHIYLMESINSAADEPVMEPRDTELENTEDFGRIRSVFWIKPTLIALSLGVVSILSFFLLPDTQGEAKTFEQAAQISMGPSLSISPFEIISPSVDGENSRELESMRIGLHYELVDKISRFKDLFVVELNSDLDATVAEVSKNAKTQFLLRGSIQKSDTELRITSILSRTSNGEVLWSRSYDRQVENSAAWLEIQSDIAVQVAANLGKPDSQIHARFIAEQSIMGDLHIRHYKCLMRFYQYLNSKSEERHREIRNCLEVATTEMPQFSSGWAALTWMHADEDFNKFNLRPDQDPPLQRALAAAMRAVTTDPENAMAFQYLASAQFWVGNNEAFIQAAETALKLNPNDAEVLALFGNYLMRMDRPEQGLPLIEKALLLNPTPPSWYYGSLVIYYYLRNDSEDALKYARKFYNNNSLASHILYVVVLAQNDRMDEAKTAFNNLVEKYPFFPNQYESVIKSRRIPTGLYQKTVDDLILVGLTPIN